MPSTLRVLLWVSFLLGVTTAPVVSAATPAVGEASTTAPKTKWAARTKSAPRTGAAQAALLERPAFSLSKAELESLRAPGAPAGLHVEVLLDETVIRFDARGLRTREYHSIYRVLSAEGAESTGSVRAAYGPWYEKAPEIRARVLTKEGAFFNLDVKTLVEAGASSGGGNVYSDRRYVSGPLPAVRIGSIVETRILNAEHKPFFDAGMVAREPFYVTTFTGLARIDVYAPTTLALRVRGRAGAPKPSVKTQGDTRFTRFTLSNLRPLSEWPPAPEPNSPILPTVEMTTGSSWKAAADLYGRQVDQELGRFDAKAHVAGVLNGTEPARTKAVKLLAYVHAQVRYTGLEIGERSILPNPPADTLARHYGDCKDKSTLLVGLLRAANVPANVALLSAGPGTDVAEDMPGLGLFDHAIVVAEIDGKSVWIDPTDPYSALGVLPYGDQDRLALVASSATKKLTRTPRIQASASVSDEEVRIAFPDLGRASVREISRGTGTSEAILRATFDAGPDAVKERVKAYVKDRYNTTVAVARSENAANIDAPFSLVIESTPSRSFETFDDGAFVEASPHQLYEKLPAVLYETPASQKSDEDERKEAEAKDPRYVDPAPRAVYIDRPHVARIRYVLSVPDGFAWHTLPEALKFEAEGIRATRSVKRTSDREAEIQFELFVSARTIPAKRIEAVREALYAFGQQATASVRFVHAAREELERKNLEKALALHRKLVAEHPKSVPILSRYAQELLRAGFGMSARAVAKKLAKEHPDSAHAQWTLGYVLLFDEVGRDSYPGADFSGAEAALRRALRLDAEEVSHYKALAVVLKRRALRKHPFDQRLLAELEGIYEKLRSKFDNHSGDIDLLNIHLWRRQYGKLKKLAAELPASDPRDGAWVAAVALTEGAEAAERKAEQLAGGAPSGTLGAAVGVLMISGDYDVAATLTSLPVVRRDGESLHRTVDSAQRRDACIAALPPAARAAYSWLRTAVVDLDQLENPEWLRPRLREPGIDAYSLRRMRDDLVAEVNIFGRKALMFGGPLAVDALPCFLRWDVKEQAGAVRVRLFAPGAPTKDDTKTFYLRKNGGGYDVVAARIDGRTAGFSRAMLLALADQKLPEARAWLAWAKPMVDSRGGFKDRANFYDALKALWPKEPAKATAAELSLVAAAMGVGIGVEARDNRILEAGLKQVKASPERTRALQFVLSLALVRTEPQRVVDFTTPIRAAYPEDKESWQRHLRALLDAKRHDELRRELTRYEARYPDDRTPVGYLDQIDRREGHYAKAVERAQARVGGNVADQQDLNNLAWAGLFAGGDIAKPIQLAKSACEPREGASWDALHTLATLHAEAGNVDEAYDYLRAAFDKDDSREVGGATWLAVGMLAGRVGLKDAAIDALRRVEKPEVDSEVSSYRLAQRKLKEFVSR